MLGAAARQKSRRVICFSDPACSPRKRMALRRRGRTGRQAQRTRRRTSRARRARRTTRACPSAGWQTSTSWSAAARRLTPSHPAGPSSSSSSSSAGGGLRLLWSFVFCSASHSSSVRDEDLARTAAQPSFQRPQPRSHSRSQLGRRRRFHSHRRRRRRPGLLWLQASPILPMRRRCRHLCSRRPRRRARPSHSSAGRCTA